MGIPGLLDPKEGLSIFSPNFPNWENIHVVDRMKAVFDFPVFIDNDVRVNLYGEWRFGSGAGYRNVVLLTLGTGLGSGIINDGKVVYGTTSSAGEIGHMNMYREGRPCSTRKLGMSWKVCICDRHGEYDEGEAPIRPNEYRSGMVWT